MKCKRRIKYFYDNVLPTSFYPFFFKRITSLFLSVPAPGRYITITDIYEFEVDPSLLYDIYVNDYASGSSWYFSFYCGEIPSPDIYTHQVRIADANLTIDRIDKFYSTGTGASNSNHTYQTNFDIYDVAESEFVPKVETVITKLMLIGKPYCYNSGLYKGNPKYYDSASSSLK